MKSYSFTALALSLLGGSSLWAGVIGTFDINGTITVTNDSITWKQTGAPETPNKADVDNTTGFYAGILPVLDGTQVTILNLARSTEPVDPNGGTFDTFPAQPFISFDAAPLLLAALDINHIFEGIEGTAQCLATPAAVGQRCTPSSPITPGPSPFSFVNEQGVPGSGVDIQSSARFVFSGVTGPTGQPANAGWQGIFTSQFNTPFQDVLAAFAPGGSGSVTNTYSATITVFELPTAVPEPASMFLIGLALLVVPVAGKKFKKRESLNL